jgi:hypothetical protein
LTDASAQPAAADLIWEDEPPESRSWWLSRTHFGDVQVFIAPDPLTRSLLCLRRAGGKADAYDVMVVVDQGAEALATLKQAVAVKLTDPAAEVGRRIWSWRLHRAAKLALNQTPLAAAAVLVGALLGLAVALFAVSTSMVGWPMLAAGILIGAASGPLLKFLVDRRFKSLLGPWGRFWVATLAAAFGAFATAGGLLTLFWA